MSVSMYRTLLSQDLQKHYPVNTAQPLTDSLFIAHFKDYIQRYISIVADDQKAHFQLQTINSGFLVNGTFYLNNIPANPQYFDISNLCLTQQNPQQQNIVEVYHHHTTDIAITSLHNPVQTVYVQNNWRNKCAVAFAFIKAGIHHVIPLGVDHILFMLAMILGVTSLTQALVQATAFTLAHSITLILSGLGLIIWNSYWVEIMIVLSIIVVCFETLFINHHHILKYASIMGFGLIHGAGFASAFLDLKLPSQFVLTSLITFNIGVEIAQIIIILVCYILLKWVHKTPYKRHFVIAVSCLIILCCCVWLYQRI